MAASPARGLLLLTRPLFAVFFLLLIAGACSSGASPTATLTLTQSPTATVAPTPENIRAQGLLLPSVAPIVDRVKPSVVSISVEMQVRVPTFFGPRIDTQQAAGTGVIFNPRGYVVTNNHVVEGATTIAVTLSDERTLEAELVGRDPTSDLAVIKIPDGDYPAVAFADPDKTKVGDWVIAIGNALDLLGGPTVTLGIVGALDRVIQTEDGLLYDMIQTDAAINPGNSGGPLINLEGEVIGINTAKAEGATGIGFSVGAFTVVPVVESILEHGRVVFAWLGVGVEDVTPVIAAQQDLSVKRGALVISVTSGSPASKAGIRPGDVLTAFNGREVDNVKQLQRAVRASSIGSEAEVTVVRGKDTLAFPVTLEEQPRDT